MMGNKPVYAWHQPIEQHISSRIVGGSLHHAVLINGPSELGKAILLKQFAQHLLCEAKDHKACGVCKSCTLFSAGNHPDFHEITTEKVQIGVDAVRKAIDALQQTAQLGGNKVCIITNAERMTVAASNALLKTLEEPTAFTYLLMSANQVYQLLPTILSRCEKHRITLPSLQESHEFLQSIGCTDKPSKSELSAFKGSPIAWFKNQQLSGEKSHANFLKSLEKLKQGRASVREISSEWIDQVDNAIMWLSQYFCKRYAQSSSCTDHQLFNKCIDASKKLNHQGVNKELILTNLLLLVTSH